MSYVVLARKYRPQKFTEVYAQNHVVQIIKNAIETDRIGQAYLFTGSRGVGKTSLARILAKSLNCELGPTINPCCVCTNCTEITIGNSSDVIEIDGASNTSVDDIRDLQKELMYSASHSKYKIFIIDEVHMLSKNAFNALLKTLEEPPKNVIFIFATTEPHKILPTIISRCQRFDFKRIPVESIVERLKEILVLENISADEDALFLIAKKADGGMRDAMSLMDQVLSYGNIQINSELVRSVFGMVDNEVFHQIMQSVIDHNPAQMIFLLNEVMDKGIDINEFINSFLEYLRTFLLIQLGIEPKEVNQTQIQMIKQLISHFSQDEILYIISYLIDTKNQIKQSHNAYIVIEMCFIKLSRISEMKSIENILKKLEEGKITIHQVPSPQSQASQHKMSVEQSQNIEKQLIKETKETQPLILEVNYKNITTHWEDIKTKFSKEYLVAGSYLNNCKIDKVENNGIHLSTDSTTGYQKIKDHVKELEDVIFKHLNLKIKIFLEFREKEKTDTIRNPSLQDIQKESPDLAKFIEITDSRIT